MGAWPVALVTGPEGGVARVVGVRSPGVDAVKLADPGIRPVPGPVVPANGAGGVSPAGVWLAWSAAITRATAAGQNEPSVTGVAGPSSLNMAISRPGSGRLAGFFCRHASMTWRSPGGIMLRSGSAVTIRNRIDAGFSPAKGGWPVAA